MSVTNELDGSVTVQVNLYSDKFLIRFIIPNISFDAPGRAVFASEGCSERGTVLTFRQNRSGYNMESKDGVLQCLSALGISDTKYRQIARLGVQDIKALYRSIAFLAIMPRVPSTVVNEDLFIADLLLAPVLERLEVARTMDPEYLVYRILKIVHSLLAPSTMVSYKDRYRTKLLELEAKFRSHRGEFRKLEIDGNNQEDLMYQLLMCFGQ
jgi:hypothetical protein